MTILTELEKKMLFSLLDKAYSDMMDAGCNDDTFVFDPNNPEELAIAKDFHKTCMGDRQEPDFSLGEFDCCDFMKCEYLKTKLK